MAKAEADRSARLSWQVSDRNESQQMGRIPRHSPGEMNLTVRCAEGKGNKHGCSDYQSITLTIVPGEIFAHELLSFSLPALHYVRQFPFSFSSFFSFTVFSDHKLLHEFTNAV